MTALYTGEFPLDQVSAAFSSKLLEKMEMGKMENEAAASVLAQRGSETARAETIDG
jgi:hypothetical protein